MKIKTDVSINKKPSTPDQFHRIKKGNENKFPNYSNNIIKRPLSKTKNDAINQRPSTAPQKDKKSFNSTMKPKNSRLIGPNKRLPSPQIQSSGLGRTQKINMSRYRAPSPNIKSGLNMTNTFKSGLNRQKFY